MNQKIKELMEQMVIKMLEDDLNQGESTISSKDGQTIVTMKQNSMVSLLLYLQLTSGNNGINFGQEGNDLGNFALAEALEEAPETMVNDSNEEEKKQVLEKITALQKKNRQFQQEIDDLLSGTFP